MRNAGKREETSAATTSPTSTEKLSTRLEGDLTIVLNLGVDMLVNLVVAMGMEVISKTYS